MGMIEGSSLRIIVGTYSALGTLEEMSWKGKKEVQQPEEKPVESGQKHKGHDNSALFSCSQVLPKLAANPAHLHPCGRSSKPLVYYRAPPGLPSTPMCHSLLDPQQMSTQLCLKGRTESEITVCKGEISVHRGRRSLCVTTNGCISVKIASVQPSSVRGSALLAVDDCSNWHE